MTWHSTKNVGQYLLGTSLFEEIRLVMCKANLMPHNNELHCHLSCVLYQNFLRSRWSEHQQNCCMQSLPIDQSQNTLTPLIISPATSQHILRTYPSLTSSPPTLPFFWFTLLLRDYQTFNDLRLPISFHPSIHLSLFYEGTMLHLMYMMCFFSIYKY